MKETVYINDVMLDVNPTDIIVHTNRFVEEMDLIRENSPFSFSSPHGYTGFSMIIAFNKNDDSHIEKLVSISTELDKFPFVWIKSNRLTSNINGSAKTINGIAMYAVESWNLTIKVETQGVIYLTINGVYFNHIPLVANFNFLNYSEDNSVNKDGTTTDLKLTSNTSFDPMSSNLFKDFFAKERALRLNLANRMLGKGSMDYMSFSLPMLYADSEKQNGIDALAKNKAIRKLDIDDDPITLELTPIVRRKYDGQFDATEVENLKRNTSDSLGLSDGEYRSSILADVYHLVYLETPLLTDANNLVQEISISKRNKIAMNKMQGYTEPMLQYMGKAPASLNIVLASNGSGYYTSDPRADILAPASLVNMIFQGLDAQTIFNQRMAPFKNIKINNFLTAITGSKYFILDKKTYAASSQEQGVDYIYLSMVESDLTTLAKKTRVSVVPIKDFAIDKKLMISVIIETLKVVKDLNFLVRESWFNSKLLEELGYDNQSAKAARALTYLNSELLVLKPYFMPSSEYINPDNEDNWFNFDHLSQMLSFLSANSTEKDDFTFPIANADEATVKKEIVDSIRKCFEALMQYASSGDVAALAPAKKILEDLKTTGAYTVEQISGEALPDLKIGESISEEFLNGGNPQNLSPFYFLKQEPYLDSKSIKSRYDIVSAKFSAILDELNNNVAVLNEKYSATADEYTDMSEETPASIENLNSEPVSVNVKSDKYGVIPIIKRIAQEKSVDENIAIKIAEIESNFNPNVISKTGNHFGLYQISKDLLKEHTGTTPAQGRWKDVETNARIGIEYIKIASKELRKSNVPVTWQNVYLSFQQGPWGFPAIYNAYVNGVSASEFESNNPKIAKNMRANNPAGGRWEEMKVTPISPSEFVNGWYKRLGGNRDAQQSTIASIDENKNVVGSSLASSENSKSQNPTVASNNNSRNTGSTEVKLNQTNEQTQLSDEYNASQMTDSLDKSITYDAKPLDSPSQRVFEGMATANIDIFKESHQAQYRALRTGSYFEQGLSLTIPTVKIYAVEGNENDLIGNIKEYKRKLIELYGFSDIKVVTPTEDDPVALCTFSILNPLSSYSDVQAIAASSWFKKDFGNIASFESLQPKILSMRLIPGMNIIVKMGYGNNPNDLETVFSGIVTETEGEEMISVLAEGHGRELVLVNHFTEDVEILSSSVNTSTSGAIHDVMYLPEIMNFGERDRIRNASNPYARNILGDAQSDNILPITWKTRSELFTNVFSMLIEKDDPLYLAGLSNFTSNLSNAASWNWQGVYKRFPAYNMTPWDILKEMQSRHPGVRSQVLNYEYRNTFFFGIKEQLYYSQSPTVTVMKMAAEQTSNAYSPTHEAEYERYLHLKPVADFHIFTSQNNIISNQMSISNKFATQVNVRWFDDTPEKEDFETNAGNFKYYTMQIDDNISARAIRSITLNSVGCDHKVVAARYGQVELRKEIEKMYDGSILIIGNPYVKAGDFAFIDDRTRNIIGVIKIRECIHHFNTDKGFVTEIVPGLYAEESSKKYSMLIPKLSIVASTITNDLIANSMTSSMLLNEQYKDMGFAIEGLLTNQFSTYDVWGQKRSFNTTTGQWENNSFIYDAAKYIENNAGELVASGASGAAAYYATKSAISYIANSSAVAALKQKVIPQIGGVLAKIVNGRLGSLAKTALGLFPVGRLLQIAGVIALRFAYDTYEEIQETRQPIRIYPVFCNGISYTAGIDGFEDNSWVESKILEAKKTGESISSIWEKITGVLNDEQGSLLNNHEDRISEMRRALEVAK